MKLLEFFFINIINIRLVIVPVTSSQSDSLQCFVCGNHFLGPMPVQPSRQQAENRNELHYWWQMNCSDRLYEDLTENFSLKFNY